MDDTFRHKGLRKILIDSINKKGISDNKVLNIMNEIPRHLFMDNAFVNFAYQDKAFPIGSQQTISQPYTVAFQTQLLNVSANEKILEIGTGSGYQTAVLIGMEANVYTIESQKDLFLKAKDFLPKIGYNCHFFFGDGYKGLHQFAPFDKILITCGAPSVPDSLLSQLRVGGLMVAPIGSRDVQVMNLIEKISDEEHRITTHGNFSFVPMLDNKETGKKN